MAERPTIAELEAAEAHAKRELFEAIRELVDEVGEADAERVMEAVNDGLALGMADAVVELYPQEVWKPGRGDAGEN